MTLLTAQHLDRASYSPYGAVVAADPSLPSSPANLGTARRFNRLAVLENRRESSATPNVCVFRSRPHAGPVFRVTLLEKHPESTQLFVPMGGPTGGATRYLVIVAQGGDAPDLLTLRAFVARGDQGISYHPGIWHHPLIALDRETDFACVVYENDTALDCVVRKLDAPIEVAGY